MSTPRQAVNRHARTRRDHAMETAEDYVEAICEFTESHDLVASRTLPVGSPSVA